MKIKFNFAKFDKATAFQVLEQDANFLNKKFLASNGILLVSKNYPQIADSNRKLVNIRGTNTGSNLNTVINYFPTNDERDHFYDQLIQALDEFSKNEDKWEAA